MGQTLMERATIKWCPSRCECQKLAAVTGELFTILAQAFVKCHWPNTFCAPFFALDVKQLSKETLVFQQALLPLYWGDSPLGQERTFECWEL